MLQSNRLNQTILLIQNKQVGIVILLLGLLSHVQCLINHQQYYQTMIAALDKTIAQLPAEEPSSAGLRNRCRACRQNLEVPFQPRFFCNCRERYMNTHPQCFKENMQDKINSMLDIGLDPQKALTCDKCLQNYKISYEVVRQCSSYAKFKRNLHRRNFEFGGYILGIVVSIIIIAACSDQLAKSDNGVITVLPFSQKFVLAGAVFFSAALMVLFLYKLAEKFLTVLMARVVI